MTTGSEIGGSGCYQVAGPISYHRRQARQVTGPGHRPHPARKARGLQRETRRLFGIQGCSRCEYLTYGL